MKAEGLTLYLKEAKKHCSQNLAELDELRDDLIAGNFRRRDYRAVERVLQVYTELCIGLAKHWLKSINKESASDAYRTFSLLREQSQITAEELANWRKILGMRNGLVHDYLNIDLAIVEGVVRDKHYETLNAFCLRAISVLGENK